MDLTSNIPGKAHRYDMRLRRASHYYYSPWDIELDESVVVLDDLLLEGGLRQGHHLVGGRKGDHHYGEEDEEGEVFA
ncbi:hypothetical protein GUJ93_ZPchr0013g34483 [Zizania palustris]|uniref:Uncharacterized protein n=1 Tax=Zizania palustris TaxID=103762 RepID=A0A8J6BXV3_ZIZPA|nr:hypothetical protein GUJ93_ZPchr0013g34483 [Zizania palustris]